MVSRHTMQSLVARLHQRTQQHQSRQEHLACSKQLVRRHHRRQKPSSALPSTKICSTPSALRRHQQRSLRRSLTSYENLLHPTKISYFLRRSLTRQRTGCGDRECARTPLRLASTGDRVCAACSSIAPRPTPTHTLTHRPAHTLLPAAACRGAAHRPRA